jgi:hypothetical protein
MVLGQNKGTPEVKHNTREEACNEAERLAGKHPKTKFYVLEAVAVYEGTCEVKGTRID